MTEGAEARRGKDALSLSGGHLCHVCGHQYPNPNPSAKLRRSHRRNCRRATPETEQVAARERNAAEGPRVLGGGVGGPGAEPGNAAASGGSVSPGSAEGGGDSADDKENAEKGNGTNLAKPCINGVQHKVPKTSTEIAPLAVAHPVEREDSFDEYQDASSFLHQSDPEDGAAVAHESDIPMEIKNLDKGSVGTTLGADVISADMNGLCKDEFSNEPSMPDFPAGSEVENKAECYLGNITPGLVGCQDSLNLQSPDECSADFGSNDTNLVVERKPDKTSDYCESRKVDSFLIDGMDILDGMSEVSPRAEIAGTDYNGSETISNSGTNSVPTGDELKVIHTENTCADFSMERSSHNLSFQDASDVQLLVDNSGLLNSTCCEPGYQNDLAVTNVDGTVKSITEHSYSDGILVKGGELDSSCEERPQQDVEQVVTAAEGNTSLEKHNGFCTEEVCNRESDTEVPTKYQVSSSQEHVTLLMDQVSSIKNPFNLDDTRSEDLFELSSGSYHFEEPNVVESKQHFDTTTLTVSSITSVADGQQGLISDDRDGMLAVSSENGYAVGAEDVSVSISADPTKNIVLHDASVNPLVNHRNQGGESHTNDTSCVPSQVLPIEFGTMPLSQEVNALSTYVGEKIETEGTNAKDTTAVESIDNFEEEKQTEDASAKELNAALLTENVEEEKQAEGSGVKEAFDGNNQSESTESREVSVVQRTVNIHEKDQAAKKVDTEFCADDADNRQTDGTDKEEMYAGQHADEAEEKKQAQETSAKETNEDNVARQKQAEGIIVLEGNKENQEIAAIGSRLNSARISVPLKVLLAEASLESKEKKPSTKERVLSFRRRASSKEDTSSAKPGSAGLDDQYWNSPAKLPHERNVNKGSKARKQPWMPFICCHSVH